MTYVNAKYFTDFLGLKSPARRQLNGVNDKGPASHGLGAYRGTISTADIKADPLVSWVMEKPNLNLWSVNETTPSVQQFYVHANSQFILGWDTIATS
jgi:hypothetical protein